MAGIGEERRKGRKRMERKGKEMRGVMSNINERKHC
jgi:hypothetical protein